VVPKSERKSATGFQSTIFGTALKSQKEPILLRLGLSQETI